MKKIVVLNHKNYLDYNDIKDYINNIKDYIRTDIDVVIAPSSIYIPYFLGKYNFYLGSQDLTYKVKTGDISSSQLKSMGVKYSIIGHSERCEDAKTINLKIKESLSKNIIPIVCVGETKEERSRKKTALVIAKQLKNYFYGININRNLVIAYEPRWAIGTGDIPKNEDIYEVISFIKMAIFKKYNIEIRVIYGGSVDTNNVDTLASIEDLDGFLLGKVSIDVKKVCKVMNTI